MALRRRPGDPPPPGVASGRARSGFGPRWERNFSARSAFPTPGTASGRPRSGFGRRRPPFGPAELARGKSRLTQTAQGLARRKSPGTPAARRRARRKSAETLTAWRLARRKSPWTLTAWKAARRKSAKAAAARQAAGENRETRLRLVWRRGKTEKRGCGLFGGGGKSENGKTSTLCLDVEAQRVELGLRGRAVRRPAGQAEAARQLDLVGTLTLKVPGRSDFGDVRLPLP